MDFPPVPSPRVKSPPWHMNCGITRWNLLPLYPNPFSPVHRARKFSAVFGTTSANSSNVTLPSDCPPISKSKYTLGFFMVVMKRATLPVRAIREVICGRKAEATEAKSMMIRVMYGRVAVENSIMAALSMILLM